MNQFQTRELPENVTRQLDAIVSNYPACGRVHPRLVAKEVCDKARKLCPNDLKEMTGFGTPVTKLKTVDISDQIPESVYNILAGMSKSGTWFLLNRRRLRTTQDTLDEARSMLASDERYDASRQLSAAGETLRNALADAKSEAEHALNTILTSSRNDVFGAYRYFPDDRPPSIEVYWFIVWLVSQHLQRDYRDLLSIVFMHEYAHYFTHYGPDANQTHMNHKDRVRWNTTSFENADDYVKEGLAQFYTQLWCDGKGRKRWKHREPREIFDTLIERLPEQYSWHQTWKRPTAEQVRAALRQVRQLDHATKQDLAQALE
jgi:hypothetical protein